MLKQWQTIFFICLANINVAVFAAEVNYLGIDYKYRIMHGDNTDTYQMRNVLPSNYNEGQVYYAHRFASGIGFDLTYEQSQNKQQTHVFINQQVFLGGQQNNGDVTVINNRIMAGQFNILGYANVNDNIEALGQIGFSIMHADMTGSITSGSVNYNLMPSKVYEFIPRVGFGLQYFFAKLGFGLRAIFAWEGTDWYRMKMTNDDGVRYTIKPFKESWCFGIGLVAKF